MYSIFNWISLNNFCWVFVLIADEAKKRLQKVGYEQLLEREDWKLEAGKRYFFTRNHSTIVAFAIGKKYDFSLEIKIKSSFLYFVVLFDWQANVG